MEIANQNFFNRLSLNQKILSLLVIEVLGFVAVALVAFTQVYTVGDETKQMSSITTVSYTHLTLPTSDLV